MKKVLAIAVLMLLASVVMASNTNWMFYVQTGSPDGMDEGIYNQIGVKPTSIDAITDSYDLVYDLTTTAGSEKLVAQNVGAPDVYQRDYRASWDLATAQKTWDLKIAGLSGAPSASGIKLVFRTGTSTAMRAPVGVYKIKLKEARGQTFAKPAWAGGGVWADEEEILFTVPTTTNTVFGQIDLPILKLVGGNSAANLVAQGYNFEVKVGTEPIVPEPGSLLALGTGLIGLVGFVSRRRRV